MKPTRADRYRRREGIIRRGVATAFLILLLAAVWQGCGKSEGPARQSVIVISGDTDGWITPCGCTANQSGGLPRRATYLAGLRGSADVLYFDAGGAGSGDSAFELAKLEAIFDGEKAMGISAHNIGGAEAAIGPEALQRIADSGEVPLLSANVRRADGTAMAPAMRVFPCQGKRLAVIGVMSPRFAAAGFVVDEPRSAILATLAAHKGEFDSVLILAYLPEEELRQLASSLPEADAIVGRPTGQSIAPQSVGPVLVAAATNKGKFLVNLRPPANLSGNWTGEVVELGPTFSDDANQIANLHAYLGRLRDRDFTAAESGFAPALPAGAPGNYRIAGSSSCTACHAEAETIWIHSLHAGAGKVLEARGFDADPDCLRCHTTGYGLPGGFVSPRQTAGMYGVGCENCHGPSESHVIDPVVHTQYQAFDQCVRCHDEENSPKFDRAMYWQRIKHGKPATAPSQAETMP